MVNINLYRLTLLSRRKKQIMMLLSDIILLDIILWISFSVRFGELCPMEYIYHVWYLFFLIPLITIPFFISLGLYRAVIKYIGNQTIFAVVKSISFSVILIRFIMTFLPVVSLPRSIFIIYSVFSIVIILAHRYLANWLLYIFSNSKNKINIAIFGAGNAGAMLAENIKNSEKYSLKAIIDDEKKKVGTIISSVRIFGSDQIQTIIDRYNIKSIFLAIPSIGKAKRKDILNRISEYQVNVMELPSIENIIDGRVTVEDVKSVEIIDLLGRIPVEPINGLLNKNIVKKNVLITGAGGSIGSELSRQVVKLGAKRLVLYEQSEFNLYSINQELVLNETKVEIIPVLASVQDELKFKKIIQDNKIDTVYHSAAYKHVPMVEVNPSAAILNNIIGTYRCVSKAVECEVETLILISTDKAVRPTNVMGATKRFAELILQAYSEGDVKTKLSMVRFGNVLDSAGSVVPLFRKQIKDGGPVTVTHPEIVRFFMSIPEAVELVIQAGAMSEGGDVFVLDMGSPIKIVDLAKKMINLSGFSLQDPIYNPYGDIEIKYTGLRPGEKLYEELLIGDNDQPTKHPQIMKAKERSIHFSEINSGIEELIAACDDYDDSKLKNILKKYIQEYNPS